MGRTEPLNIIGLNGIAADIQGIVGRLEQISRQLAELRVEIDVPGLPDEDLELVLQDNLLRVKPVGAVASRTLKEVDQRVVAESAAMRVALGIAMSLADSDQCVLIQGETGTGKQLLARTIHQRSRRRNEPFQWFPGAMMSTGQTAENLKSTLDEVGAGTLFIDGLEDIDLAAQQVLSAHLESHPQQCDWRLLAATAVDLSQLVSQGAYSAELWQDLQGGLIVLPPLRERSEDIESLARYHLRQLCRKYQLADKQLSREYLQMLHSYHWPGNVRELVNTLEQSLVMSGPKPTLFTRDLPTHVRLHAMHFCAAHKQGL